MLRAIAGAAFVFALSLSLTAQPHSQQPPLDKAARAWVDATLKKLSLEQIVGQMVFAPFQSTYLSSDTDAYDELVKLVHETQIGGVIAFGGTEPIPQVMLNNTYGAVVLGQPMELASILNRLQSISTLPLLASSDFEWGVQMRIAGATKFPRAMAFGAAGDPQLAYEAGKVTGTEARALGIHVDFAPVADVNNNPRNPVINIRSFGEDPARVGEMVGAFSRGLQDAGVLATLKHFPGHGDTDVDSHLGLPVVPHPRERVVSVELPPFKAGIMAGAAGVMVAHIELPALDPEKQPATFSPKVIGTLLRPNFDGLIYSDSMKMAAITKMATPGEAAVRAVKAGIDVILDSPDSAAAAAAVVAAVKAGEIPRAQVEQSARRILEAKARLGLHRTRTVNLDAVPLTVGGRKHDSVARAISEKSITLIKDARNQVPLPTPRTGSVLYLSVLDYPSGWRIAAPSRAVIPALRARWPNTESVEISDRSTPSELDLVRAMADNYDAVVAGVFVRASSASGRLDLAPPVVKLLQDLARSGERRSQSTSALRATVDKPFVAVFFGNPYTPMFVPEVPAMLMTYDFSDYAEESAVKAIAGEIAIGGKLPIVLPGLFPMGHGLTRAAR
ncbi:MAG: glycoside hydrolase family 3 protein [Cyanobacteria bacterium]|nr:glycoside hydrolase family 3 protein [Cyanobacteriota bacterium]